MAKLRLKEIPTWEEVNELYEAVLDRFLPNAGSLQDIANVKRGLRRELPGNLGGAPYYGLREVVFFGLLFFTGCRISEILAVRKKDVNLHKETITIRQLKRRKGKELEREVLIPPAVKEYLKEYVIREVKGEDSRLFGFTRQRAWQLVKELTERVLGRPVNPHAFRHTFAIRLLKTTKDIEKVRRLLGHSDYNTIKVYLDYTIEDMREDLLKMFGESSQ